MSQLGTWLTPEHKTRIAFAFLYGFVIGTICVGLGSFINVWLYPELPLFINWEQILWSWLVWVLSLTVAAGVAVYAEDGWGGVVFSAFLMAAIILVVNFMQAGGNFWLNVVLMAGLSLPFTTVMAPIAYAFIWLTRRFVEAQTMRGVKRFQILTVNFLVLVALGVAPGLYPKFNRQASESLRLIHAMLQGVATSSALPLPLQETKDFAKRQTQPYTLSQTPSKFSTEGVDVTAHYADGYQLRCTVVLYPGSDPYLKPCEELAP
ncbi:MAG: hypothetical protein IT310_05225 [Anaerolineales bacterium]|nr:hypothetical protein [Anaerolineales bacterium]